MDRHGDPRFYTLLEEIAALHSSKNHDYAPGHEPLANFRKCEAFGIPAWKGVLTRMSDKWSRLEQLSGGKNPKNESIRDTLLDLSVYSLICLLLHEDATAKPTHNGNTYPERDLAGVLMGPDCGA